MKRWLMAFAVLACLVTPGCGQKDQGPANPDDTPTVDEADVQKAIDSSYPPEMMKQYGKSGGGSAPPSTPPEGGAAPAK